MIFLYFLIFLFGLLVPLFIALFGVFELISQLKGAPFVSTKKELVRAILKKAYATGGLNKEKVFLELGSGDGRVVREAVKGYRVKGIGIELNPFLVIYSKIISKIQGLKNIEFKRENFFKSDLNSADIIFLFLMPETLERLKNKFLKECKKGTLIISHGFKIPGFEKYLVRKISRKIFPTHYYKIW